MCSEPDRHLDLSALAVYLQLIHNWFPCADSHCANCIAAASRLKRAAHMSVFKFHRQSICMHDLALATMTCATGSQAPPYLGGYMHKQMPHNGQLLPKLMPHMGTYLQRHMCAANSSPMLRRRSALRIIRRCQ